MGYPRPNPEPKKSQQECEFCKKRLTTGWFNGAPMCPVCRHKLNKRIKLILDFE